MSRSALAATLLASLALGACENPFSPEASEPGVYKGPTDPLTLGSAEEREAALRERFELIQRRGAAGPVAESGAEGEADADAASEGDTG